MKYCATCGTWLPPTAEMCYQCHLRAAHRSIMLPALPATRDDLGTRAIKFVGIVAAGAIITWVILMITLEIVLAATP